MFGPLNGQLAAGVEMDDLGHAVERAAVLAQDVLVLLRPGQLHVHEALAAPEDTRKTQRLYVKQTFLRTTNKGPTKPQNKSLHLQE